MTEWPRNAYVGQRVTLRRNITWAKRGLIEIQPEYKRVYTIREIVPDDNGVDLWLRFNEIVNAPLTVQGRHMEPMYDATEFRPVQEKKTDISVFTEILDRQSRYVGPIVKV